MYHALGNLVSRTWPVLLAGWVVVLVLLILVAPPWEQVTDIGQTSLLPADVSSNRGQALLKQAFPHQPLGSSVVIVLSRADAVLRDADKTFIQRDLEPALEDLAYANDERTGNGNEESSEQRLANGSANGAASATSTSFISRIQSLHTKVAGPLLVSPDQRATLVVIDLSADFQDRRVWPTIQAVENLVERLRGAGKIPTGLDVAMTGSAVVARDVAELERQSVADIEVWTICLVVVMLLLIYRAPLLALIPLLTVFVSVEVAIKLLALLAASGWVTISESLHIYITILAYGAGVDYCLFLTARYSEELNAGRNSRDSVAHAIGKVGGALTASAFTVIGGIGMLYFGAFAKYHQAGICIPLSLLIVLVGTLTFSAPLLRLAGRWAFWPQRPQAWAVGAHAHALAGRAPNGWLAYNPLSDIWQKVGSALLRRPGTIWLATAAALTPFAIVALFEYGNWDYGLVSSLPAKTSSVRGTRQLEKHFSSGITGPVTVLLQTDALDFRSAAGQQAVAALTEGLQKRQQELELADLRSLARPSGITAAAKASQAELAALNPSTRNAVRDRAIGRYISDSGPLEGQVTRLDLVLTLDPLSRDAIAQLGRLEDTVRAELPAALADAQIAIVGPTASLRDLQTVTTSDLRHIELLVPVVVLLILIVVLRDVATSLYLIVSVLFSYLVTLGMTFALFWAFNPSHFGGLDWKVPILLFAILVAVGEDYNIFLMTRVKEETLQRGPIRGVVGGLIKTGGIISSCGFIMAGTFTSLLAGSLVELKQLGFALAVGVLLDTLVVRPILVPAFLLVVQRSRIYLTRRQSPAAPVQCRTAR